MSRLVVGVDSSTQSVKAEARELETGQVVGVAHRSHPPTTPPRSEQDPAAWWDAMVEVVTEVGGHGSLAAISVAGQQHGMVCLDADGAVIRPAKLWNDTESAPEAAGLVDALGEAEWAVACGSVPVPAFTVTKLAWLANHEPESFDRLASVLLPHDWLTYRLTGRRVTDRGDASGTGYWSPSEGRWRTDLLELVAADVDWGPMLPTVLRPFDPAGWLLDDVAASLGLGSHAVLIGPGTGDNMAAAMGMGMDVGDVAISLGTSGTVYSISATPTADASGTVAGFADATGRFLPLVCTLNATKVTEAIRRLLGVDHGEFDALALSEPAGSGGVVVLPYFDGERTPNRPDATGSVSGLRSDVRQGQLARAAVEGVVCGLLDGLDALQSAGVRTDGRLFLLGGGGRSAAYQRVVADLTQRTVLVPDEDEHVAAGACVQAAMVAHQHAGRHISAAELAASWGLGCGTTIEPDRTVDPGRVRRAYAALRA